MTKAQNLLYFREWAAARAVLVGRGFTPKEADAQRHALHREALGAAKSHAAFSNKDFDKVLATFRGLSRPDDLVGQVHLLEMERTRWRFKVGTLLEQLGEGEGYRDAIVARMARERGISSDRFEDLGVDSAHGNELEKLVIALETQVRRDRTEWHPRPRRKRATALAAEVAALESLELSLPF